jgi:hypothetical protein
MSWETDYICELQCEGCGRIGREIGRSDDWNRHETLFENFTTKWVGGREPGVPNYGAFQVPVCPDCGDKAKVVRRDRSSAEDPA